MVDTLCLFWWRAGILELRDLSRSKGGDLEREGGSAEGEERKDITARSKGKGISTLGVENWRTESTTLTEGKLNSKPSGKRGNTKFSFCRVLFYLSRGKGLFSRHLEMQLSLPNARWEKEGKPSTSEFGIFRHSALSAVHLPLLPDPAIIVVALPSPKTDPRLPLSPQGNRSRSLRQR